MNYLFILADQWRHADLSCAGHPVVKTPNLDMLAKKGTRFENMVVQSPVCGPSRLCYFTGRYMHSHRSQWNGVPLPPDERGIGEIMAEAGYNALLCGKGSGAVGECGLVDAEKTFLNTNYRDYLLSKGYESNDPVSDFAMSVTMPNGEIKTCWDFEACPYPLRVSTEDSPCAYLTGRAIDAIDKLGEDNKPWIMHLSYIWPHWPLGCTAPYNSMYDPDTIPEPIRAEHELHGDSAHPLLQPFREERRSVPFDNEWVWRHARACYYGMMSEVDAQLGRLFEHLEKSGRMEDTVIIFTSDHGEYLGDHWMFEKELFYDQAVRVPMIVYHPGEEFDATRGSVRGEFVESVDVLPTILDSAGINIPSGIQGRSLLPLLRNNTEKEWRSHAVCEWDFEFYNVREKVNAEPSKCYGTMIMDERFKYIHYIGVPCQLFDRVNDPEELHDLAGNPKYETIIDEYRKKLLDWRLSTEDRAYSGPFYDKVGMIGVTLESDKTANYGVWTKPYSMDSSYTLKFAELSDLPSWMELVTLVRYNFPLLEFDEELEKYRQTVIKNINRNSAICVIKENNVVGVLIFSYNQNCLSCMAVHPEHRNKGIATSMIKKMLSVLPCDKDLWVITFREDDEKGIAPRALYKKLGFDEDELLIEHNYPHQKFILRRNPIHSSKLDSCSKSESESESGSKPDS